jgi:glycosyltransferase involved in cell wall biosynthesis
LDRGNRSAHQRRSIDVLVQARKSSPYVLKQLVPALRQAGLVVEVQTGWVDDLVDLFNRSTVYIYDSAEYWRGRGVTEGFGLPPLEALACGCVVFSSLNHALADFGDPGHTLHQIGCGRLRFDLERIKDAVAAPQRWRPSDQRLEALLQECSEASLLERWRDAFAHLDALEAVSGPHLNSPPTWWLRQQQLLARLRRVVNRLPGWPFR